MNTRRDSAPVHPLQGASHPELPDAFRVAGLGCRRGCAAGMIRALLSEALTECGLEPADLSLLATIDRKAREPGLLEVSDELGLSLSLWPVEVLNRFDGRLGRRSERVLAATGCSGVAESAALAAASHGNQDDERGRLVLRRRQNAHATVAIAQRVRNESTHDIP